MKNEILLIMSLFVCYGGVLVLFRLLGKLGLFTWTVIATITANIEVLILIVAFGVEQTLGNVLFASSFLVTDILSEIYGKKEAGRAVKVGCVTSVVFIILSQYWLQYVPSANDFAMPSMQTIFSNTPRVMIAGLVAYAISEAFDVWAYHKWWNFTEKKTGSHTRFLWLRNNGSTLISQLINTLIFTWGAFGGVYDIKTVWSITLATYLIYIVTSICDTPFVYIARVIYNRAKVKNTV